MSLNNSPLVLVFNSTNDLVSDNVNPPTNFNASLDFSITCCKASDFNSPCLCILSTLCNSPIRADRDIIILVVLGLATGIVITSSSSSSSGISSDILSHTSEESAKFSSNQVIILTAFSGFFSKKSRYFLLPGFVNSFPSSFILSETTSSTVFACVLVKAENPSNSGDNSKATLKIFSVSSFKLSWAKDLTTREISLVLFLSSL